MVLDDTAGVFTVHFTGTTTTHTVATHSPVQIYSTGTTPFSAQRSIYFDGLRFTEGPPTITATHSSTIDGICTPRGLRGCIAYRRAVEGIQCNKAASDAIALNDNKANIMATFSRETERFLKELNGIVPFEQTVALFVPKTRNYVIHLKSTRDYLIASPGPKDATIPELPKEFFQMKAPLEVWIHGKQEGERTRRALEMWTAVNQGFDRFRLGAKGEKPKVEGLKVAAAGDWWVIKVGEDLVNEWFERQKEKNEATEPRP
jgi:hypothetical protein